MPELFCDATSLGELSPFDIRPEDAAAVCANESFSIIREYLAGRPENGFCASHANCTQEQKETWRLHRDILHTLLIPIVQLFNRASSVAEAALCASRSEDLELAYRGDARGAFLWLQCFLADEDEWCHTRGCSACATIQTLSIESTIRLALTASALSQSCALTPSAATPALPDLTFFQAALLNAVSLDPFWGSSYLSYLESRAEQLTSDIQALVQQYRELEVLVTSPAPSPGPVSPATTRRRAKIYAIWEENESGASAPTTESGTNRRDRISPPTALDPYSDNLSAPSVQALRNTYNRSRTEYVADGPKIVRSKLAKRQLKLKAEEDALARRLLTQCWQVVAQWKMRQQLQAQGVEARGGGPRRRSLTCP